MKKVILLLSIFILIVCCEKKKKSINTDGFSLNVTVRDLPDSTKVYLYDENIELKMDSSYVVNETFRFNGRVDLPSLCYLFFFDSQNNRSENYVYLFLENQDIYIDGKFSDFFNAKITGSNQTDLLNKYRSISVSGTESNIVSNQVDFLYSNANNQMALNELLYKKKEFSKDSLLLFYEKLDFINANSPKGQELLAYSKIIQIKTGDKFRDISGIDIKNSQHKLSDFSGKVILLDFWSPDCPYSRLQHEKELPGLIQKYNQEDFVIVSYFIGEEKDKFEKSNFNGYNNWLNITDLKGMKGENISKYDVTGTPNSFLINKNGIIVKSFIDFHEGENRIEKEIDKLLK